MLSTPFGFLCPPDAGDPFAPSGHIDLPALPEHVGEVELRETALDVGEVGGEEVLHAIDRQFSAVFPNEHLRGEFDGLNAERVAGSCDGENSHKVVLDEADGQSVAIEHVEHTEGDAGELRASLRVVEEVVPSAGYEIGCHGEFRREDLSERHCLFPLLLIVGIARSLHKPIVGRLPHGHLLSCVF